MRNLIYAINLTLDGCCDHTKGISDEELHAFYAQLLSEGDTFVYGRKTYELMVPFWPDMARTGSGPTKELNDFAKAFDSVGKIVVFSKTMQTVQDNKTIVIRDNLKDEILKLKSEEGKSILTGGVDVPSQLIQLGLVDEYIFVMQPLIVGEGTRLFDKVTLDEKLQLIETIAFASGSVALRYAKD